MNMILRLALAALVITKVSCCSGRKSYEGNSGNNGNGNNGNYEKGEGNVGNNAPNTNPLKQVGLDPSKDISPYDNSGFDSQSSDGVKDGNELACSFEGSCCWGNVRDPIDQYDWFVVKKNIDPTIAESLFGTTEQPNGNYLGTALSNGEPTGEARFVSCSISCSKDILVILRKWTTSNTILEVCSQSTLDTELLNCADVSSQPNGEVQVQIPGSEEPHDIVIVARNLVGLQGDGAMVDDVTVDFLPCGEETTEEPDYGGGGNDDSAACDVQCSFESGSLCGFTDSSTSLSSSTNKNYKAYEDATGRYGNPVTGVREADPNGGGEGYAAAYLLPNEAAGLEADNLGFTKDYVIEFCHYEATYGIQEYVCYDSIDNCPWKSDPLASNADRQWSCSRAPLPAGTQKVIIGAENNGKNQGAAAIDNIRLLAPGPGGPNDVDGAEPIC